MKRLNRILASLAAGGFMLASSLVFSGMAYADSLLVSNTIPVAIS
jgi:hypothetical protein